uniref:Putative secreted protein n=1 Tax=Panstrongylus lignarius TaxID=156445 RepID=A0A224Y1Y3_9HEMI
MYIVGIIISLYKPLNGICLLGIFFTNVYIDSLKSFLLPIGFLNNFSKSADLDFFNFFVDFLVLPSDRACFLVFPAWATKRFPGNFVFIFNNLFSRFLIDTFKFLRTIFSRATSSIVYFQ